MHKHFLFISIFSVALLLGCNSSPQPISRTSGVGELDVEIWASQGCIKPGETIQVRATVTNRGDKTQVIDLKDKPVLDLTVYSLERTQRWSEGKALTAELTRLELAPGKSKTIEAEYTENSTKRGGQLVAEAKFFDVANPSGGPLTSSVTIYVGSCPGLGP